MTDIVERLRLLAAVDNCQASLEAAAEIERLRDRLEIDPSHPYDGIYARDETIRGLEKQIASLLNLLADERTESMRLRAALRLFACDCSERELCKFPHGCTNYIARAALEAEGVLAKQEGK